jgi:hypothetical protein
MARDLAVGISPDPALVALPPTASAGAYLFARMSRMSSHFRRIGCCETIQPRERLYPFRPLPFLSNPHLQTLLSHLMPGPKLQFPTEIRSVPLSDGDSLAVHDSVPLGWRDSQGIVILVHGLGGCHRSGYMLRLARRFLNYSCRVLRLDLRGVGAGVGLSRRTLSRRLLRRSATGHFRCRPLLAGFRCGRGWHVARREYRLEAGR